MKHQQNSDIESHFCAFSPVLITHCLYTMRAVLPLNRQTVWHTCCRSLYLFKVQLFPKRHPQGAIINGGRRRGAFPHFTIAVTTRVGTSEGIILFYLISIRGWGCGGGGGLCVPLTNGWVLIRLRKWKGVSMMAVTVSLDTQSKKQNKTKNKKN